MSPTINNSLENLFSFSDSSLFIFNFFCCRLPQDIYQTAKVAKVLLLLEKGRGKEFRGKTLNEIEFENDNYSSESETEQEIDDHIPEEKSIRKV